MVNLERQTTLFERAVKGDSSAREQLILDNMGVARSIAINLMAGKKSMTKEDHEDEIQAAYMILIEGIDKMISKGYMFNINYLTTYISNGLKSYYRMERYGVDNSSIMKNNELRLRRLYVKHPMSIDSDALEEVESDVCALDTVFDNVYLEEAVATLSSMERDIIRLMFYENLTQKEVGERLGIKQNTVSVKYKAILKKLKSFEYQ